MYDKIHYKKKKKPNPQGGGIWGCSLWEEIGHEGGALMNEISALKK